MTWGADIAIDLCQVTIPRWHGQNANLVEKKTLEMQKIAELNMFL